MLQLVASFIVTHWIAAGGVGAIALLLALLYLLQPVFGLAPAVYTGGAAQDEIIFDTLANLVDYPPTTPGRWFYANDQPGAVLFFCNGASWLSVSGQAAPGTQVSFFLDAAGGKDTNNGSTATPWKTLTPLFQTLSAYVSVGAQVVVTDQTTQVNSVAGTFVWPLTLSPSAATQMQGLPGQSNTGVPCVIFKGQRGDAGGATPFGSRTQSGALGTATRAGVTCTVITDTAGGLTVHALRGFWVRYTNGAGAKVAAQIEDNTANTITLVGQISGPIAGDLFVIERAATIFQAPVGPTFVGFDGFDGSGGATFYGCRFTYAAGATAFWIWQRGTWQFTCCEGDTSAVPTQGFSFLENASVSFTGLQRQFGGANYGVSVLSALGLFPTLDTNTFDGMFFHGGTSQFMVNIGGCNANRLVMVAADGGMLWGPGCNGSVTRVVMHAPSALTFPMLAMFANGSLGQFVQSAPSSLTFFAAWAYPRTTTAVVQISGGAYASFRGFQIVSNTYGTGLDGISVDHRATLQLSAGTSGAGSLTGVGVHVQQGSTGFCTDPGAGTTITGTTGDVTVGGNAAGDTWANINAGATANVSDSGAANTQGCLLMKA